MKTGVQCLWIFYALGSLWYCCDDALFKKEKNGIKSIQSGINEN